MTDENKQDNDQTDFNEVTDETTVETAAETDVTDEIDPKDAEIAELKEKLNEALRNAAASQTQTARVRNDAENGRIRVKTKFAGDLLDVADTFEQAREHAPKAPEDLTDLEAVEAYVQKVNSFVKGIEQTESSLQRCFNAQGIQQIEIELGETMLDTDFHEVVAPLPNNAPKDTILGVARSGYTVETEDGKQRLLRAAQVAVSTGP
jgi:molecular chaperone GrpE